MKNKSFLILLLLSSILFSQQMDKDSIYLNVEKMPTIKGGFAAVGGKIKYPNIAREMGMQGVVYIGFIVNPEGKVKDPKILKSVAKILMENTKMVNSIGVSILIEVIEDLQGVNGTLGYYNVAPIIEKTFNIMGITNYSKIYTSEKAAIEALT